MTTQRDLEVLADANKSGHQMKICDKCGWYETYNHAARCEPARGRLAQKLIQALPSINSGQLGYGDNNVVFDLAESFTIQFEVNRAHGRALSLREVHRLGRLTVSESADLVRVIKDWHDNLTRRRAADGTDE